MVSKLLPVVLICCTGVIASPVNREHASAGSSEELPPVLEFLKDSLGELLSKFISVIIESLYKVFVKVAQRLESKEFKEAIVELEKIEKVIFNEDKELQGDNETKEIVQKQLHKIEKAFEKLLEEAIKNTEENNGKIADASEFKITVDELKQLVNKLYHE